MLITSRKYRLSLQPFLHPTALGKAGEELGGQDGRKNMLGQIHENCQQLTGLAGPESESKRSLYGLWNVGGAGNPEGQSATRSCFLGALDDRSPGHVEQNLL